MVTPLDENEHIDEKGTRRLVGRLIDKQVDGLFILGTQGEFPMLVNEQKKLLVEIVLDEVNGRVPVLVNVSDQGKKKTIDFYTMIKDLGADIYVLTAPGYYNVRDPQELQDYYGFFCQNLNRPILIYDSKYTNNPMSAQTILRLSELENIVGYKGSIHFELLRELRGQERFSLLCGDEKNMDMALFLGYDGIIPGLSSLAIDMYVDLYTKSLHEDLQGAIDTQKTLIELQDVIFGHRGQHWGNGHKFALSVLGICKETIATTLLPLTQEEKDRIRQVLTRYEIT